MKYIFFKISYNIIIMLAAVLCLEDFWMSD